VRLFAAVVPPGDAIAHLDAAAAEARAACADLSWIPTQRWHLTLAFYGEVADRDVARVERRGVRATRGAAVLDLRLSGAGHFGDSVLWVGVHGERGRLVGLAGALATDRRPYRPHLTVARQRRVRAAIDSDRGSALPRQRGDALPAAVTLLGPYDGPDWRAVEVVLFRSHLGPKPRHEPLVRWPLVS
jgi:2'-5' RNA ligase